MDLRLSSMTRPPPAGRTPRGSAACAQLGFLAFHWSHRQSLASLAILAADTVAVAVEPVDIGSGYLNGSLHVGGAIAAAACAVDVAGDRNAGTAVVRVALLRFLCSQRYDP